MPGFGCFVKPISYSRQHCNSFENLGLVVIPVSPNLASLCGVVAVLRVLPVGFGVCINASIDDLPSIVPEKPHSPNEFFTGSKLGFYATPLMFRMMEQLFFHFI